MTAAIHEDWAGAVVDEAPHLTEVPRRRRQVPGWGFLAVFPLAVVLTVFAIGGADGRTPAAVRIDMRDASGDLVAAGRLADRLTAAGMSVVGLRPVDAGGPAVTRTEIRYAAQAPGGLARAKAVRRAIGRGTIVASPGARNGVDVTLVIGKDVQDE
jgi:hypothetical protein